MIFTIEKIYLEKNRCSPLIKRKFSFALCQWARPTRVWLGATKIRLILVYSILDTNGLPCRTLIYLSFDIPRVENHAQIFGFTLLSDIENNIQYKITYNTAQYRSCLYIFFLPLFYWHGNVGYNTMV